jgi:gamma-tubulin complex component 2
MIHDPFNEFFISEGDIEGSKDGEFVATDDYWERRYKSDMQDCPTFLRKMSNEILKAGKYLNVIRQCGQEIGLYMVCFQQFNFYL